MKKEQKKSLHVRIDADVFRGLEEKLPEGISISDFVRDILRGYIFPPKVYPRAIHANFTPTSKHVEEEPIQEEPIVEPEVKGLVLPTPPLDRDIKSVGTILQLRSKYSEQEITSARRAKRRGLPYDTAMDPFLTRD